MLRIHGFAALCIILTITAVVLILKQDTSTQAAEMLYPASIELAKAHKVAALIQQYKEPECTDTYCAYVIDSRAKAFHSSRPGEVIHSPVRVVLFVDTHDQRYRHLAISSRIEDPERGMWVNIIIIDYLTDGVVDIYIEEGDRVDTPHLDNSATIATVAASSFIEGCLTGVLKQCDGRLSQGRLMQDDIYEAFAEGFVAALEKEIIR